MTPSLLIGVALAVGAPAPKETVKPVAKPDGEWVVETFEGPKDSPPGSVTMRFAEGKISIMEGKREKPEEADYTLDMSKKPATIDIRPGRGQDKVVLGIVEVTGDTMKLCFTRHGGERPTDFRGAAEKGVMLITLKRIKPEK